MAMVEAGGAGVASEGWSMVPPDGIRNRMKHSRGMLGRTVLAYVGDAVWEYLVLRHQYQQVARSPFTESPAVRCARQAKVAAFLWRGKALKQKEKEVVELGMSHTWRRKVRSEVIREHVEQVGIEQFSAAHGLRTLLGYLYLDHKTDDSRLEAVAREMGLAAAPGEEDRLLSKLTDGLFDTGRRPSAQPRTYFLALAPLGNVALRLYVSRYFCQRPTRDQEFLARIKMALRAEELDLAAVGFMRDDATAEELQLMRGARDTQDTYSFAFECLLGYLALTAPYRLHQIVANFGWAVPLPSSYTA